MNRFRFAGLGVIALAALALAQDAWVIKRVPTVGETVVYKFDAWIELSSEAAATMTSEVVEKVLEVEENGQYTVEAVQRNSTVVFDGQEHQVTPDPIKTVYSTTGEILQLITDNPAPPYRFANLSAFRYPDAAVKLGNKWTVEIPANAERQIEAATLVFTVEGTEQVSEWNTIRIKWDIKETTGTAPTSAEGFHWIEPSTGIMVKSTSAWRNVSVPGVPVPVANAKFTFVRQS